MAKRLKRVFTSADQVMHLWANQSQSDARCGNVFFEGTSIYSYGMHYELGRLHKVKGQTIALINSRQYSNTTSKHQRNAHMAVSHLMTLSSSDVSSIKTALLENQESLINGFMHIFSRISFYNNVNDSLKWAANIDEFNKFNKICDLTNNKHLKLELTKDMVNLLKEHITFRIERQKQLQSPEFLEKKQALKLKKLQTYITEWKQGGPLKQSLRDLNPQLLRVTNKVVQTTRGAEVPLTHAKRLFRKITKGIAKQGDKIGHFTLTSVSQDYVEIGCHTIDLNEAKQVLTEEFINAR